MIRLLIIATVALPPTSSWADDEGVEAMCHGADVGHVPLETYEFEVSGYDPGRGVVTLRLAPFIIRSGRVLGLKSVGPLLMAMSSSDLEVALEARRKDALRLDLAEKGIRVVTVYPGNTDTTIFDEVEGDWDRAKMNTADEVAEVIYGAVSAGDEVTDLDVPPPAGG